MTTSAEIESIVRRVLAGMLASGSLTAPTAASVAADSTSILRLHGKLITLASLPKDMAGIREVHVSSRAVVTPAARDVLRNAKTTMVRVSSASPTNSAGSLSSTSHSSNPSVQAIQPLIITGSAKFLPAIMKSICPRQAKTLPPSQDDASALGEAAVGLRKGHRAAVIIGSAAHTIAWQAGRDEKLRPVVVTQWSQLAETLAEVPTNLVILSTKYWNAPAASNVIRSFYKHVTQT